MTQSNKSEASPTRNLEKLFIQIDSQLETLQNDNLLSERLVKDVRERVHVVRQHVDDLRHVEASLEAVRRTVVEPVNRELTKGTKWAQWGAAVGVVGAVVGVLAIVPLFVPDRESYALSRVREFERAEQVHVIGTYRGARKGDNSRAIGDTHSDYDWGKVLVQVADTSGPVLLVLSAYEKVQWEIECFEGVRLVGVLVGGESPQEVLRCPAETKIVYLTKEIAGPEEYFCCDQPVIELRHPTYSHDEKLFAYRRLLRALHRTTGSQTITTFSMGEQEPRFVVPAHDPFMGPSIREAPEGSGRLPAFLFKDGKLVVPDSGSAESEKKDAK